MSGTTRDVFQMLFGLKPEQIAKHVKTAEEKPEILDEMEKRSQELVENLIPLRGTSYEELLAKIEELTLENEELKAQKTEKSTNSLALVNAHLRNEVKLMYTKCDLLDGEVRKSKTEQQELKKKLEKSQEEVTRIQKTMDEMLERCQKAQEERDEMRSQPNEPEVYMKEAEELRQLIQFFSESCEKNEETIAKLEEELTLVKEQLLAEQENSQKFNAKLANKINGDWEFVSSSSKGIFNNEDIREKFQHSTVNYTLTDTVFTTMVKKDGHVVETMTTPLDVVVTVGPNTTSRTTVLKDSLLSITSEGLVIEYRSERTVYNDLLTLCILSGESKLIMFFRRTWL